MGKLVRRYRNNIEKKQSREKRKKMSTNYPLCAKNVQVTTCGIRKIEELNNRQKEQRKKRRLVKNSEIVATLPAQHIELSLYREGLK